MPIYSVTVHKVLTPHSGFLGFGMYVAKNRLFMRTSGGIYFLALNLHDVFFIRFLTLLVVSTWYHSVVRQIQIM